MTAMRIDPQALRPVLPEEVQSQPAGGLESNQGPTFEQIFTKLAAEASDLKADAAARAEGVAEGSLDDLHGTMIAVKEAEISMKLVGTIRNKLLDAFHEIWRTSV